MSSRTSRFRPVPFYTGEPAVVRTSRVNRYVWNGVRDLMSVFDNSGPESKVPVVPKIDRITMDWMGKEAIRVLPVLGPTGADGNADERMIIVEVAKDFVGWAWRNTGERNPHVIARFAVEAAYDTVLRFKVASVLTTPPPRSWWREGGTLRLTPMLQGFDLPIQPQAFKAVLANTQVTAGDGTAVPSHILSHPFNGLQATYPWAFDPLRPPLTAIRIAAQVVDQAVGIVPLTLDMSDGGPPPAVLGIDLGYAAAAQMLSLSLPHWLIHTASRHFGQSREVDRPEKFPVVVVNVPDPATVAFVDVVFKRSHAVLPRPMHRWDIDRFWPPTWPASRKGTHCKDAIEFGLERLASGGVMVLLTDIISGQYHIAKKLIDDDMEQIDVMPGVHREVSVGYDRKVWGMYGCPRPTERLVTAWRRRP
jgi:hypothetical protein